MKAFRIFLLILIIIGIVLIFTQNIWVPKLVNRIISSEISQQQVLKSTIPTPGQISITTQKINEENFSGTTVVISGTSPLVVKMREYIELTFAEFKKQANIDVPSIRARFGADNPTANYEIYINSKYVESEKTESIVTDVYSYTGGAHGNTIYKVMTADFSSGKILSLSNVIKQEKQNIFTELVKKKLNNWRPEGSDTSVVFTDNVKGLTFDSFMNWSLDDQNLTIYFDQYAIGPGVIGATAFPLSLTELKDFFSPI